jgi:hypothetical protein
LEQLENAPEYEAGVVLTAEKIEQYLKKKALAPA